MLSLLRHLNFLDRLQSITIQVIGVKRLFNERLMKNVVLFLNFGGRIFKAYQLTSGVQFNQWKVLLVALGSLNRTRTIAVVPEIIILILLVDR